MSPANAQTAISAALDGYFEWALYLLVVAGFAVLVSTGGVDAPSIALTIGALIVRGYLLVKREHFVIAQRWTTPLALAYFAFFAADYFAVSRNFLPATVHLALFAVIVRMFSLRRERDYIMLTVLAFLMVLAAAVLTVDSTFLFLFAVFMLMAVATAVLLEMRRSSQFANIPARPGDGPSQHRNFACALARVAPILMLLILAGTTVLFFLLPRRSGGYLGGYAFGTDFSSGFSDHVQLGQIGQIQQSNAVVMHVQIEGDRTGRYDMRWRGVALGDFDGRTWSKPREQYPLTKFEDSFSIPGVSNPALSRPSRIRPKLIHYRVLMEPIGTNVFFLAPWAESISGSYQFLAIDSGSAVYDLDMQRAISRYEADSDVSRPSAAELESAGEDYPAEISDHYLTLPQMDPRVWALAAQITASAKTNYDKASRVENYLRSHFGYTLELPRTAPSDPIANFLFERKRGHCEYFASAMAVMLRTLGIPSRVVNGFRSDEFNDLSANYVIRAKDAHAWVEAYFPGYGWQTFDPTPAGSSGAVRGWGRVALYFDAMASFWRDWVVSYDISHQYVLGQGAINITHNFWQGVRGWSRTRYAAMLEWGRRTEHRAQRSPTQWILTTVVLSLLFLLLRNASRIALLMREYRLRTHPERSPEQAAAMWYRRMTRQLSRCGFPKSPEQTAGEYASRIEDTRLREPVGRFTEVYESARFGNSVQDASRLPELYLEVETAARNR
jgi:transglutaminase-like putative cysteine protease